MAGKNAWLEQTIPTLGLNPADPWRVTVTNLNFTSPHEGESKLTVRIFVQRLRGEPRHFNQTFDVPIDTAVEVGDESILAPQKEHTT